MIRADGGNTAVGQFGMVRNAGTRAHQGVDLLGMEGQAVYAADKGEVVRTGNDPEGFGNFVELAHRNAKGAIVSYTLYGHMQNASSLKAGDQVDAGQTIGAMGRTGNLTNEPTHLHFEIRTKLLAGPGTDNRRDPKRSLPTKP